MAAFLDLPREIYLMICSLLSTADLINLASLNRNHYLAAQRPLYSNVRIGSYSALIRLIGALTRIPVVSQLTSRQRLYWHNLTDAQRSERHVEHLTLTLDLRRDADNVTGAVLAHCINAICRKCSDAKISLTIVGMAEKLIAELASVELPGVFELNVFLQLYHQAWGRMLRGEQLHGYSSETSGGIWDLVFGRFSFPNLQKVQVSARSKYDSDNPSNMARSLSLVRRPYPGISDRNRHLFVHHPGEASFAYPGVLDMREIKLHLTTLLDAQVLRSLFSSSIALGPLTKLEIVNCPFLHPIADIKAIATFLRHVLPVLQFLKLHLVPHNDGNWGYAVAYNAKITEEPSHHFCHIVRDLGQEIKSLDLAFPFACRHIFSHNQLDTTSNSEIPRTTDIQPLPACTFPDRLLAAGYRYRRLIFTDYCSEAGEWDQMVSSASRQSERISWELLLYHADSGPDYSKGMWLMSGSAPVEVNANDVMERPFDE